MSLRYTAFARYFHAGLRRLHYMAIENTRAGAVETGYEGRYCRGYWLIRVTFVGDAIVYYYHRPHLSPWCHTFTRSINNSSSHCLLYIAAR